MRRRSLLACGSAALAGCGLAPQPPNTPERPVGPPNLFASFDRLSERDAWLVTFEYGNRITPANTGRLVVERGEALTTWVSAREDDDPAASFPLAPGDSVVHPGDERGVIRVIWESPGDDRSAMLDSSDRHTAAGTSTGGATGTPREP